MPRPPFHAHRGESAVPTVLTLLVSAWFLTAAGAILADRGGAAPAEASASPALVCAAPAAIVPAIHETITVEAQRG